MTTPKTTIIELLKDELTFEHRMAMHTAFSEQIWREQNLVSLRMTWNLTFQGMLVAIYVFAGSSLHGWVSSAVQIALGSCGAMVCMAVFFSVIAAQNQSGRLKSHWVEEFCEPGTVVDTCDVLIGPFPQPFSPKTHSDRGRWASRGICIILGCLWVILVLIAAVHWVDTQGRNDTDPGSCTISRKGDQGVMLTCPQLMRMSAQPAPSAPRPLPPVQGQAVPGTARAVRAGLR